MFERHRLGVAFVVVLFALTAARTANAGGGLFVSPATCTGTNCNAATYRAFYVLDPVFGLPFTTQVYSWGAGNCIRLDVTEQQTDLEATLTCADGMTWQVDDRSETNERPVIKALSPVRGWCTLTISRFDGRGTNSAAFTLKYGVYPTANPNCSNPTSPRIGTNIEIKPEPEEEDEEVKAQGQPSAAEDAAGPSPLRKAPRSV